MNEYSTSYDEKYIVASIEQYRRQRHVYPWFIFMKAVCALGLTALIAIITYGVLSSAGKEIGPLILTVFILFVFLVLLLQGPRIDYALLRRRLKKSPFYGDELNICVSVENISISTHRSVCQLNWAAFSRARRVATGFLIFTDPTSFHWLPDEALVKGTLTEIDSLLRNNIRDYEGSDAL